MSQRNNLAAGWSFLTSEMRCFIVRRDEMLKQLAESSAWVVLARIRPNETKALVSNGLGKLSVIAEVVTSVEIQTAVENQIA